MFGALMRRCVELVRGVNPPPPDPVAREIDAAIESIERALDQIRHDFGIVEPS